MNKNIIAITYIGEPKFQNELKDNHNKFFDLLRLGGIELNIYNFTSKKFTHHNSLISQMLNTYNALEKINGENIVIRMRTDLFISESIFKELIDEIKKIINNEYKLLFVGRGGRSGSQELKNLKCFEKKKVSRATGWIPDWMIIFNKEILVSKNIFLQKIKDKIPSDWFKGNILFNKMLNDDDEVYLSDCTTFIARRKLIKITEEEIAYYYYYYYYIRKFKTDHRPMIAEYLLFYKPDEPLPDVK